MKTCPICGGPLTEDAGKTAPCPRCIGRGETAEIRVGLEGGTVPAALPEAPRFPPETNFGPYRIVDEIGRGGMGVVYRAVEVSLDRNVALKVLLAGERATTEQASRFLREARSAANLSHPNIVPVFSAGTEKGVPFFAMEYIEGTSLEKMAGEQLEPPEAARIVRDVARALAYSHGHGIVHRDVKPANILLDGAGVPKITDFGLAKVLGDQTGLTQEGTALGTPAYMSPEQAAGRTDVIGPLSDVYSLGAVLYEVLAGRPPFHAETPLHLMNKVQTEDPPPLVRFRSNIPRDLQTVCFKSLEKRPERRYRDMDSFAVDLDRFLRGEPVEAKPPSGPERLRRWFVRRKASLAAFAAAVLAALASILLFLSLGRRPPEPPPLTPPDAPALSVEDRREASFQMDVGRDLMRRAEKAFLTENPASRRELLHKALEAFTRACLADPERPEAFLEKGRSLAELERSQEALDAFDAAARINPDLTDAYYGRAQIRYRMYFQSRFIGGQESSERLRELIEADLRRIDEIGAKPEKFHTGRGLLLMLDGRHDEALSELNLAVEADPSFPDAYGARGSVHMVRGLSTPGRLNRRSMRDALKDFTEALKLSGGATQYRANRAQVLLALERYDEAQREANAVVEALPDKPYPYILRAQIRKFMGDEVGYDADMDKADAMPIENLDMHIAMAGALLGGLFQPGNLRNLRTKDVQRALKHIDALLAKHPDRTDLKGIRGLALTFLGKRDQAVADLEEYIAAFPDSKIAPLVQIALGMARSGLSVSVDSFPVAWEGARRALEAGRDMEAETLLRRALKSFAEAVAKEGRNGLLWTEFRGPASQACVDLAALLLRKDADVDRPEREEALRLLERAAELGFDDVGRLRSPAFDVLADSPRFKALLGE